MKRIYFLIISSLFTLFSTHTSTHAMEDVRHTEEKDEKKALIPVQQHPFFMMNPQHIIHGAVLTAENEDFRRILRTWSIVSRDAYRQVQDMRRLYFHGLPVPLLCMKPYAGEYKDTLAYVKRMFCSPEELSDAYALSIRTNQEHRISEFLANRLESYIRNTIRNKNGTDRIYQLLSAAAQNGNVEILEFLYTQQLFLTENKIEIFTNLDIMLALLQEAATNGHLLFFKKCLALLVKIPELLSWHINLVFEAFLLDMKNEKSIIKLLMLLEPFIRNPAHPAFADASNFEKSLSPALVNATDKNFYYLMHYLLANPTYKQLIRKNALKKIIRDNRDNPEKLAKIKQLLRVREVGIKKDSKKCVVM
jgi:hypothetical protein